MSRFWSHAGVVLLAICATAAVAQKGPKDSAAPENDKKKNGRVRKKRDTAQPMITKGREAAALAFADEHHGELGKLIRRLNKRKNKTAYNRAVRRLFQDSERLAKFKERMAPERYELQLDIWKLDSRIRLLAAKVHRSRRPNKKLQQQLDHALSDRVDLKIKHVEQERARLLERVQKLDATIDLLKKNREKSIAQQLTRVKRSLGIKRKNNGRRVVKRKSPKNTQPTKTDK